MTTTSVRSWSSAPFRETRLQTCFRQNRGWKVQMVSWELRLKMKSGRPIMLRIMSSINWHRVITHKTRTTCSTPRIQEGTKSKTRIFSFIAGFCPRIFHKTCLIPVFVTYAIPFLPIVFLNGAFASMSVQTALLKLLLYAVCSAFYLSFLTIRLFPLRRR